MNLDTTKMNLGVYLDLTLVVVSTFTGGWSEDWRVMLNSTQDQIKLKSKFELSLAISFMHDFQIKIMSSEKVTAPHERAYL